MPNYIFTTRNMKDDDSFGNEPGPTTYLIVPDNAESFSPANKVSAGKFLPRFIGNKTLKDVVVFVHGYNNGIAQVMDRHKSLKAGLKNAGYEGELISFDWPSASKPLMYLEDRHDAKTTAMQLVTSGIALLAKQQGTGCTLNVHVVAHSTGAYIIREAFDDAETTSSTAEINWTLSQLLYIAGDIASDAMSATNALSVYRHCNRFTNYFNPNDLILGISNVKRVGFKNRVGRIGLPEEIPSKAVDVNCGAYYEANISNLDIPKGPAPSHSWYFYSDQWFKDAYETIIGEKDRNVIPTRTKDENGKLILRADT